MKKLLFKVTLKFGIIVLVLLSVPYFMMGGKLPDWASGLMSSAPTEAPLPENVTSVVTDREVNYYQWVDEYGQTHYSSTPPEGGQAEMKKLRPDTNILQAVKVPEEEDEKGGGSIFSLGSSKDGESGDEDGDEDEPFNPYSPEGVQKMVDKARDAATQMEKRNTELGKITGEKP